MNLYYKIKNALEDIWYSFKWRCQRFARGYADEDMFNIDLWFIETAKPMLTYLKDHGSGFPGEFNNEDEWHKALAEMIECLDVMDKHVFGDDEAKDKFFQLFSKYFYHLWD